MIKRKRPSDLNQSAHSVLQDIIGIADPKSAKKTTPAMLGRGGKIKGGKLVKKTNKKRL
jgi:hypothetical protein